MDDFERQLGEALTGFPAIAVSALSVDVAEGLVAAFLRVEAADRNGAHELVRGACADVITKAGRSSETVSTGGARPAPPESDTAVPWLVEMEEAGRTTRLFPSCGARRMTLGRKTGRASLPIPDARQTTCPQETGDLDTIDSARLEPEFPVTASRLERETDECPKRLTMTTAYWRAPRKATLMPSRPSTAAIYPPWSGSSCAGQGSPTSAPT